MPDLVATVDNAWWYVTAAYVIILGGIGVYVAGLGLRIRRAREALDDHP